MSLPQRPWPEERIRALYEKSRRLMRLSIMPYRRRLMKRSDRIAERSFALWFQTRGIDPHAPASTTDEGRGTRRPRRRSGG
jgi:hypothetical protein